MNRKITFYTIFAWINILLFVLMLLVYNSNGSNRFINQNTVLLNTVLIAISYFVNKDASRQNNPLMAVLLFVMIFHFELRVITLNYFEYSVVLDRATVSPNQLNSALLYIIIAYVILWLSLRRTEKDIVREDSSHVVLTKRQTKRILVLLYVCLLLSTAASLGVPGIAQAIGILSTFFFNLEYMMLFALCYFIYNWKNEGLNNKLLFIAFVLLNIVIFTVIGKRGQIYTFAIMLFIVLLVFNYNSLKIKYLVFASCLAPLMVLIFSYTTLTRQYGMRSIKVSDAKEMIQIWGEEMDGKDTKIVLAPVFDRIGFLDFSTEMIKNRDYLSKYLNTENYLKSVVDNLLTPGFNLFDMPKMSNVIDKCYEYKGTPNTKYYHLEDGYYQSDCLTLFGEAFLLFGPILALVFVFIIGRLFSRFYFKKRFTHPINIIWIKACSLFLFYILLYSYGLDWFLISLVSFTINYFIFKRIVGIKNKL